MARSVIAFLRKFFDSKPQVYWWVVKRTMEMTQTIRRRVHPNKKRLTTKLATLFDSFSVVRVSFFAFPFVRIFRDALTTATTYL